MRSPVEAGRLAGWDYVVDYVRSPNAPQPQLDYRTAFDLAPIGLILSERRQIVDCNARVLEIFGAQREQFVGQSFAVLYPARPSSSAPASASRRASGAMVTTPMTG